jgi:hypothetical protein
VAEKDQRQAGAVGRRRAVGDDGGEVAPVVGKLLDVAAAAVGVAVAAQVEGVHGAAGGGERGDRLSVAAAVLGEAVDQQQLA